MSKVEWGEYRIETLFEKIKVNSLKYKTNDLPNHKTLDCSLPALTAGIENQGLNNYVPYAGATILKNVISISANGANTGATFYQNKEFTVLQDAYAIKWIYDNNVLSDNQYLFLTSSISKAIYGNYEWTNKAGWARIKDKAIMLPINEKSNIDFDFMESFVAELEAQRIAELDTYLKTTGLYNCELTHEELSALYDYSSVYNKVWESYRIGDLFERVDTRKLPYKAKELPTAPTDGYVLPCLTSSFQNQGLNYYAPIAGATILKNVISLPSNSDVYRAYYQSQAFTVLSDSYAIRWKNHTTGLTPNQYLFFVMCINRVTNLPIYSYKNKLGGWNVVKEKFISLPVKNGVIDFAFMETFISAIKKKTIKDVVKYSDEKIRATKAVITKD